MTHRNLATKTGAAIVCEELGEREGGGREVPALAEDRAVVPQLQGRRGDGGGARGGGGCLGRTRSHQAFLLEVAE